MLPSHEQTVETLLRSWTVAAVLLAVRPLIPSVHSDLLLEAIKVELLRLNLIAAVLPLSQSVQLLRKFGFIV